MHLNLATAADYLPYRKTIDIIEKAILNGNRSVSSIPPCAVSKGAVTHAHVDPYYIIHMDGHFYLIGYSNAINKFLEYRIDRIQVKASRCSAHDRHGTTTPHGGVQLLD